MFPSGSPPSSEPPHDLLRVSFRRPARALLPTLDPPRVHEGGGRSPNESPFRSITRIECTHGRIIILQIPEGSLVEIAAYAVVASSRAIASAG